MANLEKPFLRAETTTDQNGLGDRLNDPNRVMGKEMPLDQRRRNRKWRIVGGLVLSGGLVFGTNEILFKDDPKDVAQAEQTHTQETAAPVDPTEAPSANPNPEFEPMNPYTYELKGTSGDVSALDLDSLSREFTPTSTSFGEPIIEGALQTLANYEPTKEELDKFEGMARAEFEGLSFDEPVNYRELGVVMLADQVLVKRLEMVIAGTTHIPTGNLDSLLQSDGGDNNGLLAKYVIDAQKEKLKEEDYQVDFKVLRETRLDLLNAGPIDDDSYVGPAYFNTYFSATDSKGKVLGAAWIGVATTFNTNGGGEPITLEDGQEVPALVGSDGETIYDKDGNKIPALVADDAQVDAHDSLQSLEDEYTMLKEAN